MERVLLKLIFLSLPLTIIQAPFILVVVHPLYLSVFLQPVQSCSNLHWSACICAMLASSVSQPCRYQDMLVRRQGELSA